MIISVVGLPGPFTDFCRDLCIEALKLAGRSAVAVEVTSVDPGSDPLKRNLDVLASLGSNVLGRSEDVVVAVTRAPDAQYAIALDTAARPFLVAYDDPRRVAHYLAKHLEIEIRAAIRVVGTSCACALSLLKTPSAILCDRAHVANDPAAFAAKILSAAGLDALGYGEALTALVRGRAASLHDPDESGLAGYELLKADLGAESALTVEAALGGYVAGFSGGQLGRLVSTRQLFYSVEPMGQQLPSALDVTGRARWLTYGPYVNVPPGNWILRLVLAFSPEIAGLPFTVDISRSRRGEISELGRTTFDATAGRYVVQIAFSNDEPDALVEFRLFSDRPAFDGRVSIGYAELERVEPEQDRNLDTSIYWEPDFAA